MISWKFFLYLNIRTVWKQFFDPADIIVDHLFPSTLNDLFFFIHHPIFFDLLEPTTDGSAFLIWRTPDQREACNALQTSAWGPSFVDRAVSSLILSPRHPIDLVRFVLRNHLILFHLFFPDWRFGCKWRLKYCRELNNWKLLNGCNFFRKSFEQPAEISDESLNSIVEEEDIVAVSHFIISSSPLISHTLF